MFPFLLIILAAAGGAWMHSTYQREQQKKRDEEAFHKNVLSLSSSQLEKGRTYTAQVMIDPKSPQWGNINDLNRAAALIKATFEQLGWKFVMNPMIRNEDNARRFIAGEPNEWIFNAIWMKDEKYQTLKPDWVTMVLAYPLPVAR